MPWRETCAMDERVAFILAWQRGDEPMTALCTAHGISRKTGYKWRDRFLAGGWAGLQDASRAPHRSGHALPAEIGAAILALRQERPFWGPKKLRAVLRERRPELVWPAASTIGDLLRRAGLSRPRKRRRTALPLTQPFRAATAPNEVWCADFKGWFRTGDGLRCDPLTLTDAHSRYLLDCRIVAPTTAGAAPVFEAAFRRYGLPRAIRSDNGAPFAGTGAGGLTRLAVAWLKLGIALERIDPGCPQQNGRHERMHGTLKAETTRPPAATITAQQAHFDRWRVDFNTNRPHEALDQVPPARHYRPSPRPYPAAVPEPSYGADHAVRRVRSNGEIKWGGERVFISEALVGEPVGVAETESGAWLVRFCDLELGLIDRRTKQLRRFAPARPARRKAEQTEETVTHVPGP